MSSNRIAIFGAGAVGSYYGGLLADAGHDVTFIARGEHLKILKQDGLTIDSHKHGTIHLKVNASDKMVGIYNIIILCVKSQDTLHACQMIKEHICTDTVVVSFQNGVENVDILSSLFGNRSILGAAVFIGAEISKPGTMVHSAHGKVTFGAVDKKDSSSVRRFESIIKNSKIEYNVTSEIKLILWKKMLWNIAFNPLSALLESRCGRMLKDPDILKMMNDMVKEGVEAAETDNIIIPEDYWESVTKMVDGLEYFKTSMLQDIEKSKNPEVDGILGPVIRRLEKVGKKAPVSEIIYKTLQFKYGKSFLYTPKLTVDIIVENNNKLLLIERKNPPYGWALPGGFVDYGEIVENAAARELLEETSIMANELILEGVYSDPNRDNRMHTVSVVFSTKSDQEATAGDDAANAEFFPINGLPEQIAFDHRKIISDYLYKQK